MKSYFRQNSRWRPSAVLQTICRNISGRNSDISIKICMQTDIEVPK